MIERPFFTPEEREKLQVGDRFEIANPDKPSWCNGWFEVERFLSDGRIQCKKVKGPPK